MTHSLRPWMRAGLVPAAMVFILFAAGCESEPRPSRREGQPPRRAFAAMAGREEFFSGQILAEVHVGTEGMPEVRPGERGGGGGRDRGGPGVGPQGGGRSRVNLSGALGLGGNVSGEARHDTPIGRGGERPAREGGGRLRPDSMGGGGRPVMIHLRFTNRGAAAVELRITDFVSPLGNFVVRPEKLTLEPGASVEVEPMTSQLAGSFIETVATVVLRVGDKVERKSFPLKPAEEAKATAP